jgi:hypothetical protein
VQFGDILSGINGIAVMTSGGLYNAEYAGRSYTLYYRESAKSKESALNHLLSDSVHRYFRHILKSARRRQAGEQTTHVKTLTQLPETGLVWEEDSVTKQTVILL